MNKKYIITALAGLALCSTVQAAAEFPFKVKDGKIEYIPDSLGNRLLDYSSCGYRNLALIHI